MLTVAFVVHFVVSFILDTKVSDPNSGFHKYIT